MRRIDLADMGRSVLRPYTAWAGVLLRGAQVLCMLFT
jgi:hypothetical protein